MARTSSAAYWEAGLERNADLRFELVGLYVGVDTLVIHYRNRARWARL